MVMALPTRVIRGATATADPFDQLHREFDTVLSRVFGGGEVASGNGGSRWAPYGVDVREDADHFYVEAELPGFTKDDVDITLENQTLTIAAERKEAPEPQKKGGDYLLNERRYRRFLRSFTLPPTVNESKVDAKLADGVLFITLDKREESKPRKIQVK
jgi:HSP20 family protein